MRKNFCESGAAVVRYAVCIKLRTSAGHETAPVLQAALLIPSENTVAGARPKSYGAPFLVTECCVRNGR